MDSSIAGEPSGSPGPTIAMHIDNDSADQTKCRFPGCGRAFATCRGRGVHEQRIHKNWWDQLQLSSHPGSKPQWSSEEVALLANQEAIFVLEGVRFLNKALHPYFPNRTFVAIKNQRKYSSYKALVRKYVEELSSTRDVGSPEIEGSGGAEGSDPTLPVIELLGKLDPLKTNKFNSYHLSEICAGLGVWTKERLFIEIDKYINSIFPIEQAPRRPAPPKQPAVPLSRRKSRRTEYAKAQIAWTKNPCKYIKSLLDETSAAIPPEQQAMVKFWETTMTSGSLVSPGMEKPRPTNEQLWEPITAKEIAKNFPATSTSPGPDGITSRQVRAIPMAILIRLFNIFLVCGRLPTRLLQSKTTLIPKKSNATLPADFRPITVQSVLTRAFNKILASRVTKYIKFDPRQKAFLPVDGCALNTFDLDMILRFHRQKFKSLSMASIDISKAFDSVSHKTLRETLIIMGLPGGMTDYIMNSYERSTTTLSFDGWSSHEIHPTCGVKQGDPLSPLIFNMVIDRMIRRIPPQVGSHIGNIEYNALMFADDMLLFAQTPMGLQSSLDFVSEFLLKCGLSINRGKSFTLCMKNIPNLKKSVIDARQKFVCNGAQLPSLTREDEFKYLGIPFTPEGRTTIRPDIKLKGAINLLTKAPLKPQQRLFALRVVVLPGLYHLLTLGSSTLGRLKKIDVIVRSACRKWLDLPHDAPNAYFHASAKDGGLSIPSVRWLMPMHRVFRLKKMMSGVTTTERDFAQNFLSDEINRATRRLMDGEVTLDTKLKLEARWSRLLYASFDGRGLRESGRVPQQHIWITEGSRFLSGRDFVNSVKLRINALPTRSRTARGRPKDRSCRGGCAAVETLNHILQQCHRTHRSRIKRHDAIVAYVKRTLMTKSSLVDEEPHFVSTTHGLRKPDLIAVLGDSALCLDAQVVSEHIKLDEAHATKADKYKELEESIKRRYNVETVRFGSITLNYRGVWSARSAKDLTSSGILLKRELKILSSRVVVGGLAGFWKFNKTTQFIRRPRTPLGIG